MRIMVALVGFALLCFCCLAAQEAAAADADVRYVITNGGVDVGPEHGSIHIFPEGKRDGSIAAPDSGATAHIPAGTYNVHVEFEDGSAKKDIWFENQTSSGKVDKTVEIAVPLTDVRYLINNGGTDVGDEGEVRYFPPGKREGSVNWALSGKPVRLAAGSYDVVVRFVDGDARKEIWFENQQFSGRVEKAVEVALPTTDVRYVITNGGVDVKDKALARYYPNGDHDHSITWAQSGGTVRLPVGIYSVHIEFSDGDAHKNLWIDNQNFTATVEKTVELALPVTDVRYVITNNGTDTGGNGQARYFPNGNHTDSVTWSNSGGTPAATRTVVEAGTYDMHADHNGADGWLRGVAIDGAPRLTVDLTPPVSAPVPPPPLPPASLTLAAPGAAPEPIVPESGDFPYLPPVPGSTMSSGKADPSPVYVQLPDSKQPELVANSSIEKCYSLPNGTGGAAVLTAYRDALPAAGWTIVSETHQANTGLTSHYGQNGRNIWGDIRLNSGGYCIAIADATIVETKLAADLNTQCHLALPGVLFDFNKSTLKPESDAVLQQVSLMPRDDPPLKLEVRGHTDNVGRDAYNQPLSEARARSVVVWLGQHGVASGRLTSRGYGKTRPAASNATDEGRARNRRVEIANPACKAGAK